MRNFNELKVAPTVFVCSLFKSVEQRWNWLLSDNHQWFGDRTETKKDQVETNFWKDSLPRSSFEYFFSVQQNWPPCRRMLFKLLRLDMETILHKAKSIYCRIGANGLKKRRRCVVKTVCYKTLCQLQQSGNSNSNWRLNGSVRKKGFFFIFAICQDDLSELKGKPQLKRSKAK